MDSLHYGIQVSGKGLHTLMNSMTTIVTLKCRKQPCQIVILGGHSTSANPPLLRYPLERGWLALNQ